MSYIHNITHNNNTSMYRRTDENVVVVLIVVVGDGVGMMISGNDNGCSAMPHKHIQSF